MHLPKLCLAISFAFSSFVSGCSQAPSNVEVTPSSPGIESKAPTSLQPNALPTTASPAVSQFGNEPPGSEKVVDVRSDYLLRPSFSKCIDASEGITPKMQACMEEEYQFQHARLRVAYGSALKLQNAAETTLLEQSQVEWTSKMENDCVWDAKHEGQAQRLEANYCSVRITAKRAADLEAMLGVEK